MFVVIVCFWFVVVARDSLLWAIVKLGHSATATAAAAAGITVCRVLDT